MVIVNWTTCYKLGLAVPSALIGNVVQKEHANARCKNLLRPSTQRYASELSMTDCGEEGNTTPLKTTAWEAKGSQDCV